MEDYQLPTYINRNFMKQDNLFSVSDVSSIPKFRVQDRGSTSSGRQV